VCAVDKRSTGNKQLCVWVGCTGVHPTAPQPRAANQPDDMRLCSHTCPNNKTWVAKVYDRVWCVVFGDLRGVKGVCAEVFVEQPS
jgi:hypothetical protein